MIKQCIILAGGLGTRLRDAVPDLPKCMAPVAGKPFLHYVVNHFRQQGVEQFIFSLGYRHEVIVDYIKKNYPSGEMEYVIEAEPLGTGGAIRLAGEKAAHEQVLVTNGDTLFRIDAGKLAEFHRQKQAECTLSLKPMENFDRYGLVELQEPDHTIASFREKQYYRSGLINGGIYALDIKKFIKKAWPVKFSFEKHYLEQFFTSGSIYGHVQDEYFIDIGIPEDYEKANSDFQKMQL